MSTHLPPEEFGEVVDQALASLPERFRPYLENLIVEVQPRPSRRMLREMGLPPDELLLGVYHGVPLTEKSVTSPYEWPERIILFQRNIEQLCRDRDQLIDEIRRTVLHELGHHFGFDEDDLDELGYT